MILNYQLLVHVRLEGESLTNSNFWSCWSSNVWKQSEAIYHKVELCCQSSTEKSDLSKKILAIVKTLTGFLELLTKVTGCVDCWKTITDSNDKWHRKPEKSHATVTLLIFSAARLFNEAAGVKYSRDGQQAVNVGKWASGKVALTIKQVVNPPAEPSVRQPTNYIHRFACELFSRARPWKGGRENLNSFFLFAVSQIHEPDTGRRV